MNYLLWVRLLFTNPMYAWRLFWYSLYNPANLFHKGRLGDYKQHEFPLPDALERACASSPEQVAEVLNQSKRVHIVGGESEDSVIPKEWDASEELANLCYCIVRLKKPMTVVETGVARGVSSYYILRALEENGQGHLYSIEMPVARSGATGEVGKLVPRQLRARWTLIFGFGQHEMKKLRSKVKSIDMFLHDSNHTYLNQLAEYRIALAWLNKSGVLVSDDIASDALLKASKRFGCRMMVTRQAKSTYIGIIIKQGMPMAREA